MSEQIAIRIPEEDLAALDKLVGDSRYPTRAAAVRAGLTLLLREERELRIAEEYRRGYGEQPDEDWVGEAGLAAWAEVLRDEAEEERAAG